MSDWDFELAAKRALGQGGKLPRPRVEPSAAIQAANKAVIAFRKTRGDLEKSILDLENGFSQVKNTWRQYYDLVDGDDFGLDPKKPEDKKRIDAAEAVMQKGIQDRIDEMDRFLEMLSKLDRIITDLHKLDSIKL